MPGSGERVVARLAGVTVGVPDPDATAAFLSSGLGFTVQPAGDGGTAILCEGDYGSATPQSAVCLRPAPALTLIDLRFTLGSGADREALRRRLEMQGAGELTVEGEDLRFLDPSGIPVVLSDQEDGRPSKLPASGLRPRRLGHANLKCSDPAASIAFWVSALGFWLSETIGEDLAFLRYGAEHHNLGLRVAAQTTLHHLGFEVPGWDAYRITLDHLSAAGYGAEFGPGRHAVGRNMFTYLRDPSSGLRIELFCDMARVEHQDDPSVAPIRWRTEDRMSRTLNVWGSAPPPASFLE